MQASELKLHFGQKISTYVFHAIDQFLML